MDQGKSQWELNYLRRQAQINAYARRGCCPRVKAVDKILLYHPDEYRRRFRQSPCETCGAASYCDLPCQVYLQWYDYRIHLARVLAGGR